MGFKKGEKITDPAVLERLQKAREKAMEKRKEQTENKKTLQLSKALDAHQELTNAKEKLAKANKTESSSPPATPAAEELPVLKPKKTKKKKRPVPVESDTSESESDEEPPPPPKKHHKTPKPAVTPAIDPRLAQKQAKHNKCYQSMFPTF